VQGVPSDGWPGPDGLGGPRAAQGVHGDIVIGGIGCGGGTPEQDMDVAEAGLPALRRYPLDDAPLP
jgi:hypothetical protein